MKRQWASASAGYLRAAIKAIEAEHNLGGDVSEFIKPKKP